VGEEFKKFSLTLPYSIINLEYVSKPIQFVTGLTIAVVEMPMHQAQCKLLYDTTWRLRCLAYRRNLVAPYHATYTDAGNWIQGDLPFDDPLHPSGQGAAQFSQRLGSLPGPDTANISAHSAATSMSPRP
jgi:hypothetical protein